MRLIDADKIVYTEYVNGDITVSKEKIDKMPTIEAEPVKHGINLSCSSLFECSLCHWSDGDTLTNDTGTYNYCPNCGAKMDGKGEKGNERARKIN